MSQSTSVAKQDDLSWKATLVDRIRSYIRLLRQSSCVTLYRRSRHTDLTATATCTKYWQTGGTRIFGGAKEATRKVRHRTGIGHFVYSEPSMRARPLLDADITETLRYLATSQRCRADRRANWSNVSPEKASYVELRIRKL
jgi:hypothetical protein